MKLKKLFLGLTSVISLSGITTVLMSSTSCVSQNDKLFGEQNSSYAFLTFKSDDPDVKFTGNTTIKVKKGKVFGAIVAPIATKPGVEFKSWYYMQDGVQVDITPSTIIEKDLEIQPLFINTPPTAACMTFKFLFHPSYEWYHEQDVDGTCYQGFDKTIFTVGTTFDNITKPIVAPNKEDMLGYEDVWSFTGWYDSPEATGNRILNNFVPTGDMTVYAHYTNRFGPYWVSNPYPLGQTLNFTATSDNASLTLKTEGNIPDNYVYYCYDYQYDLADGESVNNLKKDIAIPIPKGHTLCVFAGDKQEPDNLMPFSYSDQNYRHFQITGDIWLSGTLEGLIDAGRCDVRIDNLPGIGGGDSMYHFYNLFNNATNNDPQSHLYISQDILYQENLSNLGYSYAPFMPFSTIGSHSFEGMFFNSGLQNIPYSLLKPRKINDKFSITIAGESALQMMFTLCTAIQSIPSDLFEYFDPEQQGRFRTCANMFSACSGLKGKLPDKLLSNLPAGESCFTNMFAGCTSITGIGERFLSPKYGTNAVYMCDNMFNGCSSLVNLPTHLMDTDSPTNGGISQQFNQMFYNCSSIVEIPKGFLSNSVISLGDKACYRMFYGAGIQRINAFLPFKPSSVYGSESCSNIFGVIVTPVSYIDPEFFSDLNTTTSTITLKKSALSQLFLGKTMKQWTITQDDESAGQLFLDLTNTHISFDTKAFTQMFGLWTCVNFTTNYTPTQGHKYYIKAPTVF